MAGFITLFLIYKQFGLTLKQLTMTERQLKLTADQVAVMEREFRLKINVVFTMKILIRSGKAEFVPKNLKEYEFLNGNFTELNEIFVALNISNDSEGIATDIRVKCLPQDFDSPESDKDGVLNTHRLLKGGKTDLFLNGAKLEKLLMEVKDIGTTKDHYMRITVSGLDLEKNRVIQNYELHAFSPNRENKLIFFIPHAG